MEFLGAMGLFLVLWGVVYVLPQVYALIRCKGWWRGAALMPLLFMIPIVWITIIGYIQESNLWPIFLIFATPLAALYLAVLVHVQGCAGWWRGAALMLLFWLAWIPLGLWISFIFHNNLGPIFLILGSAVSALPLAVLVLALRSGRRRAREGTR